MAISINIQGITYITASDLMKEIGVSRQTLWRWRQDGKIPSGHRFRDRRILFTTEEAEIIRNYTNLIEPIENSDHSQLNLFIRMK